ncbi:MAG: hydrogenase assembly protein HupF [Gammaproteobacteria bacterium (ex Lamellibrachia satsuma)]|nr:MAG: hydrogenase formation protein HypD [Gammaproteobacteria bacterium (ex Lamellibrachia satsuma)]RRS35733.1 MAG: hydrogenase assembly protein HupF [Gammaproteobacteria bacterium (ex Lamellibrachia satsuma)]RRS37010.1 MAG: hydrogenase assembly protein HupF [Gammaproteobacteria bacterium (ex Lamellibrachia satsuma)]
MSLSAKDWLQQIRTLQLPERIRIMNVCGGHERSITQAGLRGALPKQIELIPGPGCPVCVCPEEDVYQAIQLALNEQIILVAFGDMLRVPVNVPKEEPRSLDQAHAAGADIRPISSPIEALKIAREYPDREIVFFAAGFETTTAPVASLLVEGIPDNLSILLSGRLTWPAVSMLLDSGTPGFNALVAPGHVATVMGPEEWQFVVDKHQIPSAIAGFTPESLLAATYSVLRQQIEQRLFLDNCYPELVRPGGNPSARKHLQAALDVVDANWRGIGTIPKSGYALKRSFERWDARKRYPDYDSESRRRAGQMPPGCDCAAVVLGKKYPNECRLYGEACTPRNPVGPCMVSDEGACRIWWSCGLRT